MSDVNIKQIVKQNEKEFKELRKQIKNEEKCSWQEATDIACEAFDAIHGTYDSFYKLETNNIEDIITKIKYEHLNFIKTIEECLNREYLLPSMYIFIKYKNKENLIKINKKEDVINIIDELKSIINNKKIREVYYGEEYYYGSWVHLDWCKFEIYLA